MRNVSEIFDAPFIAFIPPAAFARTANSVDLF